jgi:hypothetical protein
VRQGPAARAAERTVAESVTRKGTQPSVVPSSVPPPTFLFIGESWTGQRGIFAIQDARTKASSWHQVGDKIGPYEIAGSRNGQLLVKANEQEFLVPLRGIAMEQKSQAPGFDATSTAQASATTIKVWVNGVGVEATPGQISPDLLNIYTDSKEALLHADVPENLKPMIDQALEATTVVHSDAKDGIRRSDLPPEISARMSDELLAKINAAVQKDPAVKDASGLK